MVPLGVCCILLVYFGMLCWRCLFYNTLLLYLSKNIKKNVATMFLTGPWRWFDETMLDCCEPLEKVKADGISFGKLVCLAHCAGAKVDAFRTNQSTIEEFRKYVMACSTSDDCHVISSYHRGTFKQVLSSYNLFVLPLHNYFLMVFYRLALL